MSKTFKAVPMPSRQPQPTSEQIAAFVSGGTAPAPKVAATPVASNDIKEPTARLSLDIPESLHSRFKAACARTRKKMTKELLGFIEQRTAELEKQG